MTQPILSIKQVNRYIKERLEQDDQLNDVRMTGELSNFTLHRSGHMYFQMKEQGSVMKAVMFAGNASSLRFMPKNGDNVVVRGSISVYEPSGQYQIIVRSMQPDGIGDLHIAYEQLKAKLQEEGLFDASNKRPLPVFPQTIGLITSPTGAVIQDMVTTIQRRYPLANIVFYPVQVQGEQAPLSIIEGIDVLNRHAKADLLIVGRGGGSMEDLWGFNDERVARAIFGSEIPIISAVGHETDFTIADFVADLRAPTPTAAAELATPITLSDLQTKLATYNKLYQRYLEQAWQTKSEAWKRVHQRLLLVHPKKTHEQNVQRYDLVKERMQRTLIRKLEEKQHQFALSLTKLDSLSPLKMMQKGFSAVYREDTIINQIAQVQVGDNVRIRLTDGWVASRVEHITTLEDE